MTDGISSADKTAAERAPIIRHAEAKARRRLFNFDRIAFDRIAGPASVPRRSSTSRITARPHGKAAIAHIRRTDHTRQIAHSTRSQAGAAAERSSLAQPRHRDRTLQLSQQNASDDRPGSTWRGPVVAALVRRDGQTTPQ